MPILFLPETYAPALASKQRARRSNEPDLNHRIDHPAPAKHTASSVLTRPLKLLFLEPVCALTCLFLSYASALFFLFFEAYPIIFQGTYNLSAGIAGLAFLPSKSRHLPIPISPLKPHSRPRRSLRLPPNINLGLAFPARRSSLRHLDQTRRIPAPSTRLFRRATIRYLFTLARLDSQAERSSGNPYVLRRAFRRGVLFDLCRPAELLG